MAACPMCMVCRHEQVGLTIGSALDIFGGELSYREVVEWDRRHGYV